jgi:hypothetical protein
VGTRCGSVSSYNDTLARLPPAIGTYHYPPPPVHRPSKASGGGDDDDMVESGVRSIVSSVRLAVIESAFMISFCVGEEGRGDARAAWSRVSGLATTITRARKSSAVYVRGRGPGKCGGYVRSGQVGRGVDIRSTTGTTVMLHLFDNKLCALTHDMTALQLPLSNRGPRELEQKKTC